MVVVIVVATGGAGCVAPLAPGVGTGVPGSMTGTETTKGIVVGLGPALAAVSSGPGENGFDE